MSRRASKVRRRAGASGDAPLRDGAWRCDCCGAAFDEPAYRSRMEYHGDGIYEPFGVYTCPECGSEEVDAA